MPLGDMANGVQAYWALEEASGNRADSIGSHTLVDNNTVTSGTGIIGTAASFASANNEYLSVADSSGLRIAGDFAISMWINPTALADGLMYLASKRTSGEGGWILYALTNMASGGSLVVFGGYDASNNFASGSKFTVLASGVWTHIVGLYKTASPAAFRVIVNGEDDQITAPFANTNGVDPAGGTAPLHLGASNTPDGYFNGLMDEVVIWNRMITASDATDIYNGGNGLTYPWYKGPNTFRSLRGLR